MNRTLQIKLLMRNSNTKNSVVHVNPVKTLMVYIGKQSLEDRLRLFMRLGFLIEMIMGRDLKKLRFLLMVNSLVNSQMIVKIGIGTQSRI